MNEEEERRVAAAVKGRGWVVDNIGHCRSCGAQVAWCVNEFSGKRSPFDLDGTSHFATCPQAKTWRTR